MTTQPVRYEALLLIGKGAWDTRRECPVERGPWATLRDAKRDTAALVGPLGTWKPSPQGGWSAPVLDTPGLRVLVEAV